MIAVDAVAGEMTAEEQVLVAHEGRSMGGHLGIQVLAGKADRALAERSVARVARRIDAWAGRLTRFSETSELSRLNADPRLRVPVGPTLGAVLSWGMVAGRRTGGVVDVSLLDQRLAAEAGDPVKTDVGSAATGDSAGQATTSFGNGRMSPEPIHRWSLERRWNAFEVRRSDRVRFDLGGVAKGWIADRALGLLADWPAALVDADGDIAVSVGPDSDWQIAIENPLDPETEALTWLRITPSAGWRDSVGVATSGTTVHRWPSRSGVPRHHLIDPRTGRPAVTDVAQATVVAPTTAEAEVLAKSCVILGSRDGRRFLDRSNASYGLLLLEDGQTVEIRAETKREAA